MNIKDVSEEKFLSVSEAAKVLGYSRQHVLRLIQSGEIKAKKVGRSYIISRENLPGLFSEMTPQEKILIDRAVDKTFKEYGEAIRKLGKE